MKRKHIIILAAAILIVAFAWLLSSILDRSGTLKLQAVDNTPNNADVTVQVKTNDSAETYTLRPGEAKEIKLKPGTIQVTGSTDRLKAVDIVEIKSSETTELTTPISQNRAIEQLGSNARICPVVAAERIYSYNCQGAGVVVRNTPAGNSTLFGGQSFASLQSIKDGLVGLYSNNTNELQHLNLVNESVNKIQLPDKIQTLLAQEMPFIITTGDPESSRFALMFTQANVIYSFENPSDENPAEIKPKEGIDLGEVRRTTTLSFNDDKLILYAGNSSDPHDGSHEDHEHEESIPDLPSYVFEYDFGGKLINTINLPEAFTAQNMYKLVENYYVAESRGEFNFYHYRDGELRLIYNLFGVADWITHQNIAYVQESGALYEFVPAEDGLFSLHGVFSSSDLRVSRVFATSKGVVFTGIAGNSTNAPLNIYQLLDTEAEPGANLPGIVQRDISFDGLDDLLEYGVTATQLEAAKSAFKKHLAETNSPDNKIIIYNIEPEPHDPTSSDTVFAINFLAATDSQTFRAKMEQHGLTKIRLLLHDPQGNVIFDHTQ